MRPKSLVLYAVLLLVLLGLIAVSAYSLRQYVRLRESRRIVEEQSTLEIQSILDHCRDQILRHPDSVRTGVLGNLLSRNTQRSAAKFECAQSVFTDAFGKASSSIRGDSTGGSALE